MIRSPAQRTCGFTLIELMIVVAVIAVLMSMAIPVISNARIAANEGSTVSSMRSIVSANETYKTRFGSYAGQLTDLSARGMLDTTLGNAGVVPGKAGYTVAYTGTQHTYSASAQPISVGHSGRRFFFVDHSGVIRHNEGTPATSTSPPVD